MFTNSVFTTIVLSYFSFFLIRPEVRLTAAPGKYFYCVAIGRPNFSTTVKKCQRKLNSDIRNMSTSISAHDGPVREEFELGSYWYSADWILSCIWASSNSSASGNIRTVSIINLSNCGRIVRREQLPLEKTMQWPITECTICFNWMEKKEKRRTASFLMFERHCEETMEVSRLLELRIVLRIGPRRK